MTTSRLVVKFNYLYERTTLNLSFKVVFGTPDWIRTSDLQSRSYQAIKRKTIAAQSFHRFCTI